jgi:hypothetical protein
MKRRKSWQENERGRRLETFLHKTEMFLKVVVEERGREGEDSR